MKNTVLIVDDECHIREIMCLFLGEEGLNVIEASDGTEALKIFELNSNNIDLIILDILLPDVDGFHVCKIIRETSNVPILFLSALSDEDYHLLGYRVGADDYISKPFNAVVLTAKVKQMLHRQNQLVATDKLRNNEVYLNEEAHTLHIDGNEQPIPNKEYELLHLLMNNSGRVLSRDTILSKIWGYDFFGDARVVDSHISKIRKRLGCYANRIKTVIAVGYKYEPD